MKGSLLPKENEESQKEACRHRAAAGLSHFSKELKEFIAISTCSTSRQQRRRRQGGKRKWGSAPRAKYCDRPKHTLVLPASTFSKATLALRS